MGGEQVDLVQAVQRIYAAFGAGDVDGFLDLLADDVRWDHFDTGNRAQDAGVPYLQPRTGREGVRRFLESLQVFEMHSFEPLAMLAGDGQVAAVIRIDLTVKSTGRRVRDEEIHLWTFDGNGKVLRHQHFLDTAKHIEAFQT